MSTTSTSKRKELQCVTAVKVMHAWAGWFKATFFSCSCFRVFQVCTLMHVNNFFSHLNDTCSGRRTGPIAGRACNWVLMGGWAGLFSEQTVLPSLFWDCLATLTHVVSQLMLGTLGCFLWLWLLGFSWIGAWTCCDRHFHSHMQLRSWLGPWTHV